VISQKLSGDLQPNGVHQVYIVISYLRYITIILNMTVPFKSVQINCLSICHSAIICTPIII